MLINKIILRSKALIHTMVKSADAGIDNEIYQHLTPDSGNL
jgi:hypothetical protein